MLLKFEVENYRSIRDEAALLLSSVNYYKENERQLMAPSLPGLSNVRFLRAAGVFGPNASGKSTLVKAVEAMRRMVLRSATAPAGAELPFEPYALDPACGERPTRFLAAFTSGGVRYEYGFSYDSRSVLEEKLSAFPKGREQTWFTRTASAGEDGSVRTVVSGSSHLAVPAAVEQVLNDNALLLSLLANSPKSPAAAQVAPVVEWFRSGLSVVKRGPRTPADYPFSGEILDGTRGTDFQRAFIREMMRKADVGISGTRVEKTRLGDLLKEAGLAEDSPEVAALLAEHDRSEEVKSVVFEHGPVEFGLDTESEGTYQLFGLSGHLARALEEGATIFVDEVDASLHPVLAREVVRCFLEPESNPEGAQLVFTAHNPCLLEDGLLRRDQVWFTEKNGGATELYPLSDFRPRKEESLSGGYLIGRYSATPVVPACFGRCSAGRR